MSLVRECDTRVAAYCILGGIKEVVGQLSRDGARAISTRWSKKSCDFGLRGVARPELLGDAAPAAANCRRLRGDAFFSRLTRMTCQFTNQIGRNSRRQSRGAFYDLDGTLVDLNLLHATVFMLANVGEWKGRFTYLASLALDLPRLYIAERHDRRLLNVTHVRGLQGHLARPPVGTGRGVLRAGADASVSIRRRSSCSRPIAPRDSSRCWSPGRRISWSRRSRAASTSNIFAANRLVFSRDLATGRLREPIMAGAEKAALVRRATPRRGGSSSPIAGDTPTLITTCPFSDRARPSGGGQSGPPRSRPPRATASGRSSVSP